MIRTCRMAMATVTRLGGTALWLVSLIVLVGVMAPAPTADVRPGLETDEPVLLANTVVLKVPVGRPAGNLIVVDPSGRELATLTHWSSGHTVLLTRPPDGPSVGIYRHARGSVALSVSGAAETTRIHVAPDGSMRTSATEPRVDAIEGGPSGGRTGPDRESGHPGPSPMGTQPTTGHRSGPLEGPYPAGDRSGPIGL